MKVMRYVLAVMIVYLLLFAAGCSAETVAGTPAPSQSLNAADTYRLEKLNEISDMVLSREIVPQDYFRYLDEALVAAVESYNEETYRLREQHTVYAARVANAMFYENKESPGDYDQPQLYYEWIARISHYALYENVRELCGGDPYLSYPLGKEAGGSYGMWAADLESGVKKNQQAYFAQVDALLGVLDAARTTG